MTIYKLIKTFTGIKAQIAMAESLQIFVTPQCLVESTPDGNLAVNQGVLEELQKLDNQVVVVVITGPYRTGKSYLMNRLADLKTGRLMIYL